MDRVEAGQDWINVGGPEVMTQIEMARLAFVALKTRERITCLPDVLRRVALRVLPWVTPRRIHGPAQFFLTAMEQDMLAPCYGHRRLGAHFRPVVADRAQTD